MSPCRVDVAGWYWNEPSARWRFGALVEWPNGTGEVVTFMDPL